MAVDGPPPLGLPIHPHNIGAGTRDNNDVGERGLMWLALACMLAAPHLPPSPPKGHKSSGPQTAPIPRVGGRDKATATKQLKLVSLTLTQPPSPPPPPPQAHNCSAPVPYSQRGGSTGTAGLAPQYYDRQLARHPNTQ
jgi:hypothetical protein